MHHVFGLCPNFLKMQIFKLRDFEAASGLCGGLVRYGGLGLD